MGWNTDDTDLADGHGFFLGTQIREILEIFIILVVCGVACVIDYLILLNSKF